MIQAYCSRCKGKKNIVNPEIKEVVSSRRGATRVCVGNCEVCGNKISAILPKEIPESLFSNGLLIRDIKKDVSKEIPVINNRIKKLQEKINTEKVKELKKIEEERKRELQRVEKEKLKLQKKQEKKQAEQFLKQAEENPIMIKNNLKVVKGTYYALAKIFLVLFAFIIAVLVYRTIYPEKFTPNYNSNVNVTCGDNICPVCPTNTCPACPSCNCADVSVSCNSTFNVPHDIEIKINSS